MKKPRRWGSLLAVLAVLALTPGWLRAYEVAGPSDAPTLAWGERVAVSHLAYGLQVPYTTREIVSWGGPDRGDMVLFHVPNKGVVGLKRVVAVPGDVVEMRDNRLRVNGREMEYEPRPAADFAALEARNDMGTVVELERSADYAHLVTYTPGESALRTTAPVRVPEGHYYLLGDNRDQSNDSRTFGVVPREHIYGKVILTLMRKR